MKQGVGKPVYTTSCQHVVHNHYIRELDDIPLSTLGGAPGRGHSNVIIKGPAIDEDRYDQLGVQCGEYEWRVTTMYPVREDDGDINETVYTVEGDWTSDAVEETLAEVLADVPCLKDELSVGQQCRVTERVHRSI